MWEETAIQKERRLLAGERIRAITTEETAAKPFQEYFKKTASFLMQLLKISEQIKRKELRDLPLEALRRQNEGLYGPASGEAYETSYGNPAYAVSRLGEIHGRILSFLYRELMGCIPYVFEEKEEEFLIFQELFIEVYNCFEEEELPPYRRIQQILYWFFSDYSDLLTEGRIREKLEPGKGLAETVFMEKEGDLRRLYWYGVHITKEQEEIARRINALPESVIRQRAEEAVREFLQRKEPGTVQISYPIGMERLVKEMGEILRENRQEPIFFPKAFGSLHRLYRGEEGFFGKIEGQFAYDHRGDCCVYLDKAFAERRLGVIRTVYENLREETERLAGRIHLGLPGEGEGFFQAKPQAYRMSKWQQELLEAMNRETQEIEGRFLKKVLEKELIFPWETSSFFVS